MLNLSENKELLRKIRSHLASQRDGWQHLIYGLDKLYQSYDELNVEGQRNTERRIIEYELKKHLQETDSVLDIGCNCGFIDLQISYFIKQRICTK